MQKVFKGQTALITGSGRGIGAETAKEFANLGANVVLVSKTRKQLESVANEIHTSHPDSKVLICEGDVSLESFMNEAIQKSIKEFGSIQYLINNAAIVIPESFVSSTESAWRRTLEVNVLGSYLFARGFLKQYQKSKGPGVIVNISSLAGIKGTKRFAGLASYTTSKHAVVGLTEALAVEALPLGVRVNCVAPGAVDTQMLKEAAPELKTQTKPVDIAKVIVSICNEEVSRAMHGSVIEIHSNG